MDPIRVDPPAMALALSASFGSVAAWQADFTAAAQQAGPGQVVLSFLPSAGRLLHLRLEEGQALPMGHRPVWSAARPATAAAVDWATAYERYQQAVHGSSDGLAADPQQLGDALVLDVRRDVPFQQAKTLLPGATWRDPAQVGIWAAELPRDRPVLVYCIYGHEVGRSTAQRLRAEGVDARFLPGGIDAWTQAGRPLQDKEADA